MLAVSDDISRIKASITVREDFTAAVSLDDKAVPTSQYRDIVDGPVKQL